MSTANFLFEILCEELPPKALNDLRVSLESSVSTQLSQSQLSYKGIQSFATPRRLAILISALETKQASQVLEKRGPAVAQAYDHAGQPTKACLGFLKSCNAALEDLKILKTDQGEWVYCEQRLPGKDTKTLMPEILTQAIKQLPIPKWMRWGDHSEQFARPVHYVVLMCDDQVIDATLLGLKTGNITAGHRFLCQKPIRLKDAKHYEKILHDEGFVIADFNKRKEKIREQLVAFSSQEKSNVVDEDLLNEVTGLVEWPTAYLAQFNPRFLDVPHEALVSAMKEHQKSFPVIKEPGNTLRPQFVFISNIKPDDPSIMIKGNEKVMDARLSDAEFFYRTDLKTPLVHHIEQLKSITFQKQLGSLHDKALRLEKLCVLLSDHHPEASRLGLLAKTDLLTHMVCEFTELQGRMGYYYARHAGESEALAAALGEQYLPRFANDQVAVTPLGIALSIADKLDTLVGFFGIHQTPTGNKDPFGLRRAALGIIRTILENKISLDLKKLIEFSTASFNPLLPNQTLALELLQFFNDRLRIWFKEQGFEFDVIDAVLSLNLGDINDCHQRIQAVNAFKTLSEASSLAAANKRVANILQKNNEPLAHEINAALFEKPAEERLYQAIVAEEKKSFQNYTHTLIELAALKPAIDCFFDEVMVNAEDKATRINRLTLLSRLRALFLKVADIAYLQKI